MPNLRRPKLKLSEQRQEIPRAVLECVDAINSLKTSVTEVTNVGTSPTGDAGGDLDGTYPDPTVIAVQETSGPDRLAVGSIIDGEYLKRSGTEIVSEALVLPVTPVTVRGFRSEDQGGGFVSAQTRIHWAGLHAYSSAGHWIGGTVTSSLQGVGSGQMCYAIPEYFERDVTINRLVIRTNGRVGTLGTPRVKMGVYTDGSLSSGVLSGSPYPGALIGQSGDLDIDAGGANRLVESNGLSFSISAGTRVWFVIVFNDDAVTNSYTVPTYGGGVLWPILGFTLDVTTPTTIAQDNGTGGVGWRHAITYGTTDSLPDPFPQSSPAVLLGNADLVIPAIGFGQVIV